MEMKTTLVNGKRSLVAVLTTLIFCVLYVSTSSELRADQKGQGSQGIPTFNPTIHSPTGYVSVEEWNKVVNESTLIHSMRAKDGGQRKVYATPDGRLFILAVDGTEAKWVLDICTIMPWLCGFNEPPK